MRLTQHLLDTPLMRSWYAALVAAFTLSIVGGCARARTQLVVTINSDLSPQELSDVQMRCAYNWSGLDDQSPQTCDQTWHLGDSLAEIRLPASFGVLADNAHPDDPVTIVVDAIGHTLQRGALRRVARVRFVRERTLRLYLFLAQACLDRVTQGCPAGRASCTRSEACEAQGLTCGNEGTCRSIDVSPEEIDTSDAGAIDSALRDTSAEGGLDVGMESALDAARDADGNGAQ